MRNDRINPARRRFLEASALSIAAAQFGMLACATAPTSMAQASDQPPVKPGTHTSLCSLKQINAGLLNVGYAEAGKSDSPADLAWCAGSRHYPMYNGRSIGCQQ
jgi:hypothetical protein